jgi:Skp family chaperone for outer membrane proteins
MRAHALLLFAAASFPAAAAAAQPAGTPTYQAQPLGGALIQGICLLAREAVIANAAIGKAANERLQQLAKAAQAEIDADRQPLLAEFKDFQAENAKLGADQRRQREATFAARFQPIQAKTEQRNREIEATRLKAYQRIINEAQPVIASAYRQNGCGLLLDRNIALGGNFGNDLTADVVQGLDARIKTIAFERELLPASAAAAPLP